MLKKPNTIPKGQWEALMKTKAQYTVQALADPKGDHFSLISTFFPNEAVADAFILMLVKSNDFTVANFSISRASANAFKCVVRIWTEPQSL